MKKICVVTGTRAEYGLLRWVMEGINQSSSLNLQLIVTGMHLSPEFGLTVKAIENDGFKVDKKIEMLLSSDTTVGVIKSMGVGMLGFADALDFLKPDLLLVLGDRYEILCAATSAMVAKIPIAHLHGGESTEGLIDESIRHSITKMSHLHFVATEDYRKRVIQLGENPDCVFNVGGLGIDNVFRINLLDRRQLEKALKLKFLPRNLLITFHPVTLENNTSPSQLNELLAALGTLENTGLIFTMPNADPEGRTLLDMISTFCSDRDNAWCFTSLGQLLYLSCVKQVDGVLGNSSSGLIEVPSFKKGTINIGDRQRGRLRTTSIIDCEPDRTAILGAIQKLFSPKFQQQLSRTINPYGEGGACDRIIQLLENKSFDTLLKKRFFDLHL